MAPSKYFLITNPVAGQGRCSALLPAVRRELDRRHIDYDVFLTNEPYEAAHVTEMVIEAGFTHVVAMGGDGTVNEVVNGIMASSVRLPLAVIPAGSGNDFCRMMGIPATLSDAIETMVSGKKRAIDLGHVVGDRYFVNGVGIGIDAQVARDVLRMKRLRGTSAYLAAAVQEIFRFKSFSLTIKNDDWTETRDLISLGLANGKYSGGGFQLAPRACLDDGLLDVAAIGDFSSKFARLLRLPQARAGKHLRLPEVTYHQVQEIAVSSSQKLIAHIDGEPYRLPERSFQVIAAPGAIDVMVPHLA